MSVNNRFAKLALVVVVACACTVNAYADELSEKATSDVVVPTDVLGMWRTHGDGSIIDIQPCGESICGILEWFPSLEKTNEIILDSANKDESLRTRPLKGIEFIYGFKKTSKGWRKGKIYDPESGKTYKSKLTRIDPETLKVEGCVGPVCKKFNWKKITAQ